MGIFHTREGRRDSLMLGPHADVTVSRDFLSR
jgi:hypothetical protein